MQKKQDKAQTFLEYAFLLAVVVGCLMAMRIFFLRAVQQRFRESADVFGQGEQYQRGRTITSSN